MHTKTMEGLVGARTNMNLMNTPMRVFKEARRKGDTETMERAMGYVGDFSDKAEEYKAEADKGRTQRRQGKKRSYSVRRLSRSAGKNVKNWKRRLKKTGMLTAIQTSWRSAKKERCC